MADGSRLLGSVIPGGLLSAVQGLLSASQALVIQSITSGTYFWINQPIVAVLGQKTYSLPAVAKPISDVEVFYNGVKQTYLSDYTVNAGGTTFTFVSISPVASDTITVNFISSPV